MWSSCSATRTVSLRHFKYGAYSVAYDSETAIPLMHELIEATGHEIDFKSVRLLTPMRSVEGKKIALSHPIEIDRP